MRAVKVQSSEGGMVSIRSEHGVFRLLFPQDSVPLRGKLPLKFKKTPFAKGFKPEDFVLDVGAGTLRWSDEGKSGRPIDYAKFFWMICEDGVHNNVGKFESIAGDHPDDLGSENTLTNPKKDSYYRIRRSPLSGEVTIREEAVANDARIGRTYTVTVSGLPLYDDAGNRIGLAN